MGSVLFDETSLERHAADAVRRDIEHRLESGDWTVGFVAGKLGLVPDGVAAVMQRRWSFEEAFRIAVAVGIDFGDKLGDLGEPNA